MEEVLGIVDSNCYLLFFIISQIYSLIHKLHIVFDK